MDGILIAVIGGVVSIVVAKTNHIGKKQADEIIKKVEQVQYTAQKNNNALSNVHDKLELHDSAHIATMRLRLDIDLSRAIERGKTTQKEFEILSKMYSAYHEMRGNGFIDRLWEDYSKLPLREK